MSTKKSLDKFHEVIAVTSYEQRGKRTLKLSPLRVTSDEESHIRESATKYANGNISDWMRMSCLLFKPEDCKELEG